MDTRTRKNIEKFCGGYCPSEISAHKKIAHDLYKKYGIPSKKCGLLANLIYVLSSIPTPGLSPKAQEMLGIDDAVKQSTYGYSTASSVMEIYRRKTDISPIIVRALNSFADRM